MSDQEKRRVADTSRGEHFFSFMHVQLVLRSSPLSRNAKSAPHVLACTETSISILQISSLLMISITSKIQKCNIK